MAVQQVTNDKRTLNKQPEACYWTQSRLRPWKPT